MVDSPFPNSRTGKHSFRVAYDWCVHKAQHEGRFCEMYRKNGYAIPVYTDIITGEERHFDKFRISPGKNSAEIVPPVSMLSLDDMLATDWELQQ